jgi:RimJ/RimL family protein N-acetyltransferase
MGNNIDIARLVPFQALEESDGLLYRIAAERSSANVAPILRSYRPTAIANQREWLNKIINDATCQYFIVADEKTRGWSGYCGLDKIHPVNRTAELSVLIFNPYKGQGLGKFAVTKLCDYGFSVLNLNTIFVETYDLPNSNRVAFFEKCGFTFEGRLRNRKYYNDSYWDSIMMSIVKGDKAK